MTAKQERLPLPERQPVIQIAWTIIIAFDEDNNPQVFLAKRLKEPNKNKYTLPGGSINPGETPLMCATREIEEETGIKIDPMLLTETQIEPCLFLKAGKTYQAHTFIAYLDEQPNNAWPQRAEVEKHSKWKLFFLPQITKLIIQGDLEPAILKNIWLETMSEALEVTTKTFIPITQKRPSSPAYFLP